MKFNVDNKEYEAKKLTVGQLTISIGDKIKEELMKDAIKMASFMTGPIEKSKFLKDAYRSLPSGQEMTKEIESFFQEIKGYQWIIENSIGEEVELTQNNLDKFVPLIEYALDIEAVQDVQVNKTEEVNQDTDPLEESPQQGS